MTGKSSAALDHLNLAAKLADLKNDHYRVLLTLSALSDILIEKGLMTREELEQKAAMLDVQLESLIDASLHPMA
ncbi:hypothetical protein ACFOLF_18120 [Paenibacillus sepulcri]|uniref:Uncharacterized protein n=1 Tax=Paenibacillus sepulcri TaxID=359917 RepID=A0ABS7CBK3_9BACL|nr:hypothetical protein [Paenibacillus sepulcri]